MLIMPDHIIRAHQFVGKSFFHPLCYDIEEDDEDIHDLVIASGGVNGKTQIPLVPAALPLESTKLSGALGTLRDKKSHCSFLRYTVTYGELLL